MTAIEKITAFCDTVRARIAASPDLGNPVVYDRDEDPALLADNPGGLPAICVIPLGDKTDDITFSMGSDDWQHEFTVVIAGYYKASTVASVKPRYELYEDVVANREYAFAVVELFRGDNAFFDGGNIYKANIELGYFEIFNQVIYKFVVKLHVRMIEV